MDIPSLFMIPSAVSSGKVHSVFPNSTDADFDFNRDSSATRVNSQGLIETVGYFSAEQLTGFTNGTTYAFTTFTTSGNNITSAIVSSAFAGAVSNALSVTSGQIYRVTFDYTKNSGNDIRVVFSSSVNGAGTQISNNYLVSSSGSYSFDFTITSTTTGYLQMGTGNSGHSLNVSISNVSVKEITGDRARLNYEIEGGLVNTKPSLLLEPQSTNLITYSEDFSNSYWTKGGVTTVTANFASPDGQNNAYKLSGANGTDRTGNVLLRNFNTGNSTFSLYVKSLGSTKIRFYFRDGTTGAIVNSGSFSLTNEYQRLTFSHNVANLSNFYIGDTDGDVLIFGAQIEALTYATSYIPTNGSTQTRAAETCNGAGTSSIFESSEGILYAEIAALANDADTLRWINLNNGATTNRVAFYYRTDENQLTYLVSSGTTQVFSTITLSSASSFIKVAAKWKANDFALWVDGVKVVTDTSGNAPVGLNQLSFDNAVGGSNFYGKIRDIRVYNTKEMTDSEVDILLTKITS
jgi:hypothetical protein